MKYYVYVSPSKVDMLFPQIPLKRRHKLSTEFGFNLGIASVKVASERNMSEEVTHRAQAISAHLDDSDSLGTLADPKEWIIDQAVVRVATFSENPNVVFFLGQSKELNFAIGGSSANLIGASNSDTINIGWSFLPRLLGAFEEVITSRSKLQDEVGEVAWYLTCEDGFGGESWYSLLDAALRFLQGPEMRVEFVAKSLLYGRKESHPQTDFGLLATPLYVTMVG